MSREQWREPLRLSKYKTNRDIEGNTSAYGYLEVKMNVVCESIVCFPIEVIEIKEANWQDEAYQSHVSDLKAKNTCQDLRMQIERKSA